MFFVSILTICLFIAPATYAEKEVKAGYYGSEKKSIVWDDETYADVTILAFGRGVGGPEEISKYIYNHCCPSSAPDGCPWKSARVTNYKATEDAFWVTVKIEYIFMNHTVTVMVDTDDKTVRCQK